MPHDVVDHVVHDDRRHGRLRGQGRWNSPGEKLAAEGCWPESKGEAGPDERRRDRDGVPGQSGELLAHLRHGVPGSDGELSRGPRNRASAGRCVVTDGDVFGVDHLRVLLVVAVSAGVALVAVVVGHVAMVPLVQRAVQ